MKVGEVIKEIREKQKGLRQEDVAKALGLSTKAYANIENDVTDITLRRLEEISDILGVTPEYVLKYQEQSTYTNIFNNYDGNQGTINMYQGFSTDQVKNLEEQVEHSKRQASRVQAKIQTRNN